LKDHFRPEFLNRVDDIIIFDILNENLLSKRDSLDRWTRQASLQILVQKNGVTKDVFENVEKEWINFENENFTDSLTINIPKKEDVFITTIYHDLNKHVYFENQQWWIRKKTFYAEQFKRQMLSGGSWK
jgi:hypothetical protein